MDKTKKIINVVIIMLYITGTILLLAGHVHLAVLAWAFPTGWGAGTALGELMMNKDKDEK